MRVIYHPGAEAELIEAVEFYEGRVTTLGSQLLNAVESAIIAIQNGPERCPVIEADVRRYLMPRFPFAIYYRMLGDDLRILALKHHSRHPDYWRDRLFD
jgi:plasmid stabilization system protein ParE